MMLLATLRRRSPTKGGLRRGQTMAEYAMIVAVIAIVVFLSYEGMGQSVTSMVSWQVNNDLTSAS